LGLEYLQDGALSDRVFSLLFESQQVGRFQVGSQGIEVRPLFDELHRDIVFGGDEKLVTNAALFLPRRLDAGTSQIQHMGSLARDAFERRSYDNHGSHTFLESILGPILEYKNRNVHIEFEELKFK
jgi:hypothetical protein